MSARLMTSHRFVQWLAQTSTLKPQGIAAHIGRLSGIAQKEDPDVQAAIGQYLEAMQMPQVQAAEPPLQPRAPQAGLSPVPQQEPVVAPEPLMGQLRNSVQDFARR